MADTLPSADQTATERGFIHELFIQQLEVRKAEDGRTVVRGKAQEAEGVNRDGRLYPRAILEREVQRMAQELDRRPGAVDHPEGWTASVSRLGCASPSSGWRAMASCSRRRSSRRRPSPKSG